MRFVPHSLFAVAAALVFSSFSSLAQQAGEPENQRRAALEKLAAGLNYQKGHIVLKEGLASVNVPKEFRYLDAKDSETVLHQLWGNPPGHATLGLLMPAEMSPLDEDSWAVIISYSEDGYVKDDEAATIDYSAKLKEMQAATREANTERKKEGYPTMELVGWARPPHYDQASHKLYWAKELKVAEEPDHTLNYDIRMLGRRGVLVLTAISSMEKLPEIEKAAPAVLQMVDFQEGHRYTDFNPATDKVATYGIAALVTGGILAKAGFFKLLIPTLLAFKKFIIVGAVAVVSFLKRFFGGARSDRES